MAPDSRFPRAMPFAILPDARAFARPEVGSLLFGLRESESVLADPRDLPEDLDGHVVAGDIPGFEASPLDPGRFGTVDPFSPQWVRRCASARCGKTSG